MIAGEDSNQLNTIQMDFIARRFDTFSEVFAIEYYDSEGILQQVDLTGATAQMQLKRKKSDSSPFFSLDVAISGNEITISKYHTQMDLPKGKYWHDIEVKDSNGEHITWIQGRFIVVEDVTQWVDTFISTIWATFTSLFGINDVPKIPLSSFGQAIFNSIVNLFNIPVYRLQGIINSVLELTGIGFIIKQYSGIFGSALGILTIPKTVIQIIMSSVLSFNTNISYYSTGIFNSIVEFDNV